MMIIENHAFEGQIIEETWLPDDYYPSKEEIGAAVSLGWQHVIVLDK